MLRTDRPGALSSAAGDESAFPQSPPWPPGDAPDRFSIRLTAAHVDGETDIGYGLALGDGSRRLTVAVSPLGYVAIWEDGDAGGPVYHRPWQPWPHARRGAAPNEVWLDVADVNGRARIKAWVNRELLWQGEIDGPANEASPWLGSFGEPTTVDFQALEWFAETDN
jgi:hypothetical protein